MSTKDFKKLIYDEWEQEKRNTEKLIEELIDELPDRDADDPDTCLYWPVERNWSQMIEDTLEEVGYAVCYLDNQYYIEFSEEVKEEMIEELIEDGKRYRKSKKIKLVK